MIKVFALSLIKSRPAFIVIPQLSHRCEHVTSIATTTSEALLVWLNKKTKKKKKLLSTNSNQIFETETLFFLSLSLFSLSSRGNLANS